MQRRQIMQVLFATGIGSVVFQRQLAAQVAAGRGITDVMLAEAEWVAGISLSQPERETIAKRLTDTLSDFQELRKIPIDYRVSPAFHFAPRSPVATENEEVQLVPAATTSTLERPDADDDLAFLPVASLSALVRSRKVTSLELTQLYLERLKRYDQLLKCVVTLTEDLALQQAVRADEEIAAGNYRGPLHGIPWGAKDLMACPGYPTTWGAAHFRDQRLDHTATVVEKLNAAGAVLVAKLTLGALAEGDQWFGGMTRNPFFPEQCSSGSSAGSAAAVSAGLVGFAIGSETLGSIVSPCTSCRATGLRPTFGRVSRYGCMPLSWTMDKLGPIARSVEDCAIVFAAIHGADGKDAAAVTRPFHWAATRDVKGMRVGYFEGKDEDALEILRGLGVTLVPIYLPGRQLANQLASMLSIEAAAAFDEVTAEGITDAHGFNLWGERFKRMRFVSAVDYIRANRLRSVLMDDVAKATEHVDAWIGGDDLVVTNLTGHPTVVLPHGAWEISDTEPRQFLSRSITFSGQPYADDSLLALSAAFQSKGNAHTLRPPL